MSFDCLIFEVADAIGLKELMLLTGRAGRCSTGSKTCKWTADSE